ncbi:hypothetical protein AALA90_15465 [Lachnospiraceae bacterium 38-10]
MIMFDVIKQLNVSSFCNILYHVARETATLEEFQKKLEKEVTEEWLQRVNATASLYGDQPLSFVGKQ